METYLIYIAKAALAAGAFYLAFLLLFQNQKQFVFNRLYLPVSFALSFVIPLITFTSVKYIEATPVSDFNGFTYLPDTALAVEQAPFFSAWYHYLFALYLLGSAVFFFRLIVGHLKAVSMVVKSQIQKLFGIQVHVTPADVHPFSFFSKIVVSEKTLDSPNLKMILEHENIHVREKHTLDILFSEILFLAQWFNPFAWLLKDAMKNNLEYLTDHQIAQNHNPKEYQLAMVALADKKGVAPFLNALNGNQLKNRIIMMKKKTENKYALLKQLVVLPLLAVLVMGLSNKEVKTEIIKPVSVHSNQISRIIQTEHVVKGKLTNEKGEPVPSASVIIKGKPIGTITNRSGEYEIRLEDKNEVLVFSKPGYLYREVRIKGREKINVLLYDDKKATNEEVIANGYATKQEADISNRIANDSEVHINSDTKERPLYVVDGVETDNIEAINQYNIENIDVLKDESATALYGKKGKNGVVLITTKNAAKNNSFEIKDTVKVVGYGSTSKIRSTNQIDEGFDFGSFKDVPSSGNPVVIVDGKRYDSVENANVQPDEIASISVLKNESASTKIYGEQAKNGVIVINTKTKYNSEKAEPLILVDGKETGQKIEDIEPETIYSVNVLKDESATEKYGKKGKNGVIEIKLKTILPV